MVSGGNSPATAALAAAPARSATVTPAAEPTPASVDASPVVTV